MAHQKRVLPQLLLALALAVAALRAIPAMRTHTVEAATCDNTSQALPFDLDFSNQGGCVADADGELTGFTSVQVNKNGTEYDPRLINLNTAVGRLSITSTATVSTTGAVFGSNYSHDNTQVNALETSFDGSAPGAGFSKVFTVTTRLQGPLNALNTRWEQGALYLGPDQDNYVKIGVIGGKLGQGSTAIEFIDEQSNGASFFRSVRNRASLINITAQAASIQTLDLTLVGDQEAGKVTAFYSINGGALQKMPGDVTLFSAAKKNAFFNANTRAGIMAAHKNAGEPITVTFDSFAIFDAARPGANAGPDQSVENGATVMLDGSASAAPTGRSIASYEWTLTSSNPPTYGSGVTLSSSTAAKPTFTAPTNSGVLEFSLVVTDNTGTKSTADTVRIVVGEKPITTLTVVAGTPVALGKTMPFTATVNPEATNVVYDWDFGDDQEDPEDTNKPNVTHTYEAPGTYTVTLVASNTSSSVTQVITVRVTNAAPTANAGPDQTVDAGAQVTLSGIGTDPEGLPLTYSWTQISGTAVTLANAKAATTTFIAPAAATTLTFRLTVTDAGGATATDTVQIRVSANAPVGQTRLFLPIVAR